MSSEMQRDEARGPLLLSVADLVRGWQVSERTIREEIRRGRLRPVRVGNRLRFRPEDLDRYLKRGRGDGP